MSTRLITTTARIVLLTSSALLWPHAAFAQDAPDNTQQADDPLAEDSANCGRAHVPSP